MKTSEPLMEMHRELILLSEATPASKTPAPDGPLTPQARRWRMNSCASLVNIALDLFSEKILHGSGQMHLLPGIGSAPGLNDLDMLCCPLDSGRVALALTTSGIDCSCSPNFPTLTRRDYRHPGNIERQQARRRVTRFSQPLPVFVGYSLHPNSCDPFMGFPTGWTVLNPSETPVLHKRLNT